MTQPPQQPPYGQPPYGQPPQQSPYGQPPYAQAAQQPPYVQAAQQPPYVQAAQQPPYAQNPYGPASQEPTAYTQTPAARGPEPVGYVGSPDFNPDVTPGHGGGNQQPVATGQLQIILQGSFWTSSWVTPQVMINGQAVTAHYGDNFYQLPAGVYQIHIDVPYWRRYGQAVMTVEVRAGMSVPVFYAAPMNVFSQGSIGHTKQSRKGAWIFVVLLMPVLLVMMLMIIGIALST